MRVLAINCGSATVKARLLEERGDDLAAVFQRTEEVTSDQADAVARILGDLADPPDLNAHRVVHGGDRFREAVVIDAAVERAIEDLAALAPLHNPAALAGIRAARALDVPQVAVFDTAFHATLPEAAWRYALPASVGAEVRRYGFHGLSHQSVTERYAALAGKPTPTLVTLHLGQGCSAAAIRSGACVDTSMGFSPLEGLVMGTRAGDLDPAILLHLLRRGRSTDDLEQMLNHESGLQALAGTADMRAILARDDDAARLALDVFCRRVRKYVGAYLVELGGADCIVFTGGIGENAPEVRRRVLAGMEWLGIELDPARNARNEEGAITRAVSRVPAWVIRTDEELVMARAALRALGRKP